MNCLIEDLNVKKIEEAIENVMAEAMFALNCLTSQGGGQHPIKQSWVVSRACYLGRIRIFEVEIKGGAQSLHFEKNFFHFDF